MTTILILACIISCNIATCVAYVEEQQSFKDYLILLTEDDTIICQWYNINICRDSEVQPFIIGGCTKLINSIYSIHDKICNGV